MQVNSKILQDIRADTIPLRPVYEPYNDTAKTLVDAFHKALGLYDGRPTSIQKQKVIVCAFLVACQRAFSKGNDSLYVGISGNANWWSQFPEGGYEVSKQVKKALVYSEHITHLAETGRKHFWHDEDNKLRSLGLMAAYSINESIFNLEGFVEAEFIETGRPTVLVGIKETTGAKYARQQNQRRKPKMLKIDMLNAFGKDYHLASMEVERLNRFWREHPLALPQIANGVRGYTCCASRVFHDGSLESGGRYYGAWTNLNSAYRLQCTIDGEPVAQIDLNASQPTLFSSMIGIKMQVGNMWEDLYSHVLEKLDLSDLTNNDDAALRRNKAKQVAVELIGTGNVYKRQEAHDCKYTFKEGEFSRYRNALLTVVPALHYLTKEYYNGAGYVSYHESEMLKETLHRLRDLDIIAYPIHDCLLVKEKDLDEALHIYRDTIRKYIKSNGKGHGKAAINITVPVSIERRNKDKECLAGYYSDIRD